MSENEVKALIAKDNYYKVIRVLRERPLKEESILKYLETAAKLKSKEGLKILKDFEEKKIISSFTIKNQKFYLLIKDFYIIRVPPKQTLEYIQKKSEIPKGIREKFLMSMKRFFTSYVKSNRKLMDDFEANLIVLMLDPGLSNIIDALNKKPSRLETFQKKNSLFIEKVKNTLLQYEIIEIYSEEGKGGKNWLFLKTDIKFSFFFPEYLIKQITIELKEKRINKTLALKALYTLKKSYLETEKPKQFEELNKRVQAKLQLVNSFLKKGEQPVGTIKELIKLYKSVGDFDSRLLWQKRLKEMQDQK